jgi:mRNA interferase MazF
MARILRGEVYWANLNPARGHEQSGQRPVLVLSHDVFNERSGVVIAAALTSQPQRAGFPLTSQIRTLSTERIGKRIAKVSPEEIDQVIEGLNEIIG